MNAREFVEALDKLICMRARASLFTDIASLAQLEEEAELVKRELTDYLLAADGRGGIYAKGPNE